MTKRRDRNRTARRRKRVYRFYWSHEEEHAVARSFCIDILGKISSNNLTGRKTNHGQAAQTDRGRTGI